MENLNDKKSARSLFASKRKSLSAIDLKKLSECLCAGICKTEEFKNADTVLLYSATRGEPDFSAVANVALSEGKNVAYPISQTESCTLDFRTVSSLSELWTGAYGISEPLTSAPNAVITEKTLCIVPALAVDKNGFRLGYGKGYYDRFLKNFAGYSLCAISSEHIVENIPKSDNDVPVNGIITETGVILKK